MFKSNSISMSHTARGLILALCTLVAIIVGAGAATLAQAAPVATDWTTISGNKASGKLAGTTVDLQGTQVWNVPTSRVDGSWTAFASASTFSPALPKSDVIQITGAAGAWYTITFGGAKVTNPILHLGSLGSPIKFDGGVPLTQLSSENGFAVTGTSTVSGKLGNAIQPSGNSDASGSIKLTGAFTSITFRTDDGYNGPADGILVQLLGEGGTGSPPPNGAPCANADTPITQSNLAAAEDAIVCLTNLERKKVGLAPLTVNATLRGTARAHSQDMVQRRYFEHNLAGEPTPCQRIAAAGYRFTWCGENIAEHSAATPNKIMYDPQKGWMTHVGDDGTLATNHHRNNILRPQFKELGVGAVAGTTGAGPGSAGATITQDFGTPA